MLQKAILVVSFGTSHLDTLYKTLYKIEEEMQVIFPEYSVYRAFTSNRIIQKLKDKQGINIYTVAEAMEQMQQDGIREVIVQPTHILNGIENDNMKEQANRYRDKFDLIQFGNPLLHETEDYLKVIKAFAKKLSFEEEDTAIVCMGHGTEHYVNVSYAALDYMFKASQYRDIYVATVEAYPAIEDIIDRLKQKHYHTIILIPFMMVAGEHAKNDMAGESDNSWKKILEQEGFHVICKMEGLGENPAIRNVLYEHVRSAI